MNEDNRSTCAVPRSLESEMSRWLILLYGAVAYRVPAAGSHAGSLPGRRQPQAAGVSANVRLG